MTTAARDRERHAALVVLFAAYKRYDIKSFLVDPKGDNWKPLHTAEKLGWCWFQDKRCAITDEGFRQLEPYRRTEPKPVVQWICPVCLCTVGQPEGSTGLPETVRCPTCAQAAIEAAERLRQAEADEQERKTA